MHTGHFIQELILEFQISDMSKAEPFSLQVRLSSRYLKFVVCFIPLIFKLPRFQNTKAGFESPLSLAFKFTVAMDLQVCHYLWKPLCHTRSHCLHCGLCFPFFIEKYSLFQVPRKLFNNGRFFTDLKTQLKHYPKITFCSYMYFVINK